MRTAVDEAGGPARRTFAVSAAAAGLVTAAIVIRGLVDTGGDLTYVIDHAGIHLSMARQLAREGTWGVSAGVFEPASSSPAWTLLMAALHRVAAGGAAAWAARSATRRCSSPVPASSASGGTGAVPTAPADAWSATPAGWRPARRRWWRWA